MGGGEEGETNALLTFTAGRKSLHVSPQRCSMLHFIQMNKNAQIRMVLVE